jgi:hypothetical protein
MLARTSDTENLTAQRTVHQAGQVIFIIMRRAPFIHGIATFTHARLFPIANY